MQLLAAQIVIRPAFPVHRLIVMPVILVHILLRLIQIIRQREYQQLVKAATIQPHGFLQTLIMRQLDLNCSDSILQFNVHRVIRVQQPD